MTTRDTTYGHEGRGEGGRAAFFSSAALVLLVSGALGTAAFLLLMRTGGTLWGLAAGFGWTVAGVTLVVILIAAAAELKGVLRERKKKK
jgi:membrane protein implicated in regulation of membrane protease activity